MKTTGYFLTSGHFPALLVATKTYNVDETEAQFAAENQVCFLRRRRENFQPRVLTEADNLKHDRHPFNPITVCFCAQTQPQRCHRTQLKTEHKVSTHLLS